MKAYKMTFDGTLLERGFWLYVWRIKNKNATHIYVGRTGDNSSPYANSPFNRIGQHLDFRKTAKGNAMTRQLQSVGVIPKQCIFEMLAFGPIFHEQKTMEEHKPYRDRTASIEKAIAEYIRGRGYNVLGHHKGNNIKDIDIFESIKNQLDGEFPYLVHA